MPSPVFISAILPRVQHHAAYELHVEMPHVEHTLARLADDGKRFRQQIVERLTVRDALAELVRLVAELFLGERLHLRLERADLRHARHEPLELTLVLRSDDLGEELTDHVFVGPLCGSCVNFVFVVARIAVLGAQSAPRKTDNQPRALWDIKGRALGWLVRGGW